MNYLYFKIDYVEREKKVALNKELLECLLSFASNSNASLHIQRNPCKKTFTSWRGKTKVKKKIHSLKNFEAH